MGSCKQESTVVFLSVVLLLFGRVLRFIGSVLGSFCAEFCLLFCIVHVCVL